MITPATTKCIELKINFDIGAPIAIAKACDDKFLIVDDLLHQVILCDTQGNLIWQTGSKGSGGDNFFYPTDAVFCDGKFFVVDSYNHRVSIVNMDGEITNSFGGFGSAINQFNEPNGIACIDDRFIYVSDSGNGHIKKITCKGEFLLEFGKHGSNASYYESEVFKSQAVFDKWKRSQTNYNTIETMFFSTGFPLGDLEQPKGLCAINNTTIVVADLTGFILFFDVGGELLHSFKAPSYPQWIESYEEEIYFSCEFSSVLWKINKNGEVEEYKKLDKELGKFIILNRSKMLFVAPWEKKIYTLKLC